MTSEIIDQASALEEMMRDHAIQAHQTQPLNDISNSL